MWTGRVHKFMEEHSEKKLPQQKLEVVSSSCVKIATKHLGITNDAMQQLLDKHGVVTIGLGQVGMTLDHLPQPRRCLQN
uniref:Uncharacterized protein n=1 Tax=Arion vulgaris TaxID=1028688 RepID=A0A0B7B951_9EUPU